MWKIYRNGNNNDKASATNDTNDKLNNDVDSSKSPGVFVIRNSVVAGTLDSTGNIDKIHHVMRIPSPKNEQKTEDERDH